jgi:hypothetical protein
VRRVDLVFLERREGVAVFEADLEELPVDGMSESRFGRHGAA